MIRSSSRKDVADKPSRRTRRLGDSAALEHYLNSWRASERACDDGEGRETTGGCNVTPAIGLGMDMYMRWPGALVLAKSSRRRREARGGVVRVYLCTTILNKARLGLLRRHAALLSRLSFSPSTALGPESLNSATTSFYENWAVPPVRALIYLPVELKL